MTSKSKTSYECGSVLLYIFVAIGLLGALTMSFVNSSTEDLTSERASRAAEQLYNQILMVSAAIQECTISYPNGGGDLDADGDIDTSDNPNSPYPLSPSDPLNPGGAAANDYIDQIKCPGAPAGEELIFDISEGRFPPKAPVQFAAWEYYNGGVSPNRVVQFWTSAPTSSKYQDIAFDIVDRRFAPCQVVKNTTTTPGTTYLEIYFINEAC